MEQQFLEAGTLMFAGMVVVFAFLSLLILMCDIFNLTKDTFFFWEIDFKNLEFMEEGPKVQNISIFLLFIFNIIF